MKPIKAEYELVGGAYKECVWILDFSKGGIMDGWVSSVKHFATESGCRRNMKRYAAVMNIELHPMGSLR